MKKDGHDNDEDADAECCIFCLGKIHSFRKQFQCRCEQKCILFFTFFAHTTPPPAVEVHTEKKHTRFPFSLKSTQIIWKIEKSTNGEKNGEMEYLHTYVFLVFLFLFV